MASKIASLYAEIGANTVPFEQGSKKVKGGLEGLKSGFSSVGLSSVASFLTVGGAIAGVAAGIKNASDETLKYAREVRDLAAVSGTGAEASSRLLQVLDDYELTAQDVTAATRFMTKAGLTPTIETLAKLSDQYNAINDPMQQNEFILKNLGRGGLQWVNVLKQGGTALRDQSKAVNQNLILTDKQIKETERYRLALDNMKDTVSGWKIAMVTGFLDVSEAQANAKNTLFAYGNTANEVNGIMQRNSGRVREVSEEYARAAAYGEAWGKMLQENATTMEEDAEAVKRMSEKNENFLSTLTNVGDALTTYNSGIREADAALKSGEITVKEHDARVKELSATYKSASADIVLSILEMKYATDGWTNSELNAYLEAGKGLGKFTEEQVRQTKAVITQADLLKNKMDNLGDNIYHTGKRAVDTSEEFGVLGRGASELGEVVGKDAVPPVGALKSALNGMPASGSTWNYLFNIQTNGSVPRMPTRGTVSGAGAGQINNAGNQEFTPGNVLNHWSGGQLGGHWSIVGDAQGGGITPYTEAIDPNGRIYSAKETRELLRMGVLSGAYSFGGGSTGGMQKTTSGGRAGSGSGSGGGSGRAGSRVSGGRVGGVITSSTSTGGGGGGSATVADVADVLGGQIAADVASSVSGAINNAQTQSVVATAQSNQVLKQISNQLDQLISKTATEYGIGKAVTGDQSKNS